MNGIFIDNPGDEDRQQGNLEILSRKSLKIYISLLKYWYQVLENTLKTNLKLLVQNVSFGITGEWMQLGF